MGAERIRVEVGGDIFTAWEQVKVCAAFDEACRSFSLNAVAERGASATHAIFALGTQIKIFANDDLMLDGYVERRRVKLDDDSSLFTITGRSKSCDLVDCSAIHETGAFAKVDPVAIGNRLATGLGAQFETDQALDEIESYQLTPGSTVFSVIEQFCRNQNRTLTGLPNGNVKITKAGKSRHAGGLYEGVNILSIEADHDATNRFSKLIVRGQSDDGDGPEALETEATANDFKVTRFRPRIIIHRDSATKAIAKGAAETRRDRAAGKALRCDVDVQGFHDEAGLLFDPGRLIWTESKTVGIAQDMLIESVEFAQANKSGSITSLGLVDPRAYDGDKGKGNRSSEDNDLDESEAL
jgi:prophage tail gpP-like protein